MGAGACVNARLLAHLLRGGALLQGHHRLDAHRLWARPAGRSSRPCAPQARRGAQASCRTAAVAPHRRLLHLHRAWTCGRRGRGAPSIALRRLSFPQRDAHIEQQVRRPARAQSSSGARRRCTRHCACYAPKRAHSAEAHGGVAAALLCECACVLSGASISGVVLVPCRSRCRIRVRQKTKRRGHASARVEQLWGHEHVAGDVRRSGCCSLACGDACPSTARHTHATHKSSSRQHRSSEQTTHCLRLAWWHVGHNSAAVQLGGCTRAPPFRTSQRSHSSAQHRG